MVSYITVHLLTLDSTQPTHTASTTRIALSYRLHSLLKIQNGVSHICVFQSDSLKEGYHQKDLGMCGMIILK